MRPTWFALGVWAGLQCADAVLTITMLSTGEAEELNPVMRAVIRVGGYPGMCVFILLLAALLVSMVRRLEGMSRSIALWIAVVAASCVFLVYLHNMFELKKIVGFCAEVYGQLWGAAS